ncbi:hypothetical protein Tco_0223078 [Tanacetum coccineum]
MDPDEFKAPEEAPQSLEQAPPSPDYVPGLEYLEYLAPSDDEILVEDQPLPADASPTALSPGYEEDEEGEEESFEYDEEDKEEEHLALADSALLPAIDPVPLAEETKPFETDESAATPPPPPHTIVPSSMTRHHRARIFVRPYTPPSPSTEALIPETDILKTEMPTWKKACFTTPAFRFEVGESSTAAAGVMTTVEEVNKRVTNLATTQRQDAHELYVRSWSRSEDRITALEASIRTLEAQVRTLQTQHDKMEWQRQEAGDMVTRAYGRIHALEARDRARPDDLKDADSSC